jgi:hypothetical protein
MASQNRKEVNMQTTGGDETPGFNFLVDPFKGKILVFCESGGCIEFENLTELRTFSCQLIENANKLEHRLLMGDVSAPARKVISGRYSRKAIKEWETQIQESVTDRPGESDGGATGDKST